MRNSDTRSFPGELIRNVGMLVLTYALVFVAVQASQRLFPSHELLPDFAFLAAFVAGIVCAVVFRARIAAYMISIFAVFGASESVMHSIYGIRSVQSRPVHFAVMLAAALGIILGAWMRRPPAIRVETEAPASPLPAPR